MLAHILCFRSRVFETAAYCRASASGVGVEKIEQGINAEASEIDFKLYAKYLLKEGSVIEKRELLPNSKSWLKLRNKQVVIEGVKE